MIVDGPLIKIISTPSTLKVRFKVGDPNGPKWTVLNMEKSTNTKVDGSWVRKWTVQRIKLDGQMVGTSNFNPFGPPMSEYFTSVLTNSIGLKLRTMDWTKSRSADPLSKFFVRLECFVFLEIISRPNIPREFGLVIRMRCWNFARRIRTVDHGRGWWVILGREKLK